MAADPELLRTIHFLQNLDDDERRAVAGLMDEERFPAGTVLFRENDQGGVLFVLAEGNIELSVLDEDAKKVVIDRLEPGEFFGELSLFDGGGRSTSATAIDEVVAYSLARDEFFNLLKRRSDMAIDVLTALSRRIRKTDELLRRRVPNPNDVLEERETFGERVADQVAKFGGSWAFIFAFGAFLGVWVLANTAFLVFQRANGEPFDPYPFILLNLFLSMLAAIQAPVIMMSQNRQDAKDRVRSELDYQVNMKAELEILQLHDKVDELRRLSIDRIR